MENNKSEKLGFYNDEDSNQSHFDHKQNLINDLDKRSSIKTKKRLLSIKFDIHSDGKKKILIFFSRNNKGKILQYPRANEHGYEKRGY